MFIIEKMRLYLFVKFIIIIFIYLFLTSQMSEHPQWNVCFSYMFFWLDSLIFVYYKGIRSIIF